MAKNLYFRLVVLLVALFILFAGAAYFVSQNVIMSSFNQVEQNDYTSKMDMVKKALENKGDYLNGQNNDWAIWDDSLEFAATGDTAYIDNNIQEDMLMNLSLDFFGVFDKESKLVYLRVNDTYGNETTENIDTKLKDSIQKAIKRFQAENLPIDEQEAIYTTYGDIPILTSVSRITKSIPEEPAGGFMVMGVYVNDRLVGGIGSSNNLKLSITPYSKQPATIQTELKKNGITTKFVNSEDAKGYFQINDSDGQPISVVESAFERKINKTATSSRNYYLAAIYTISLIAVMIAFYITTRLLKSRQKQLEGEAKYQLLFDQNVMPLLLVKVDKTWRWKEIVEANKAAVTFYSLDITKSYYAHPINLLYGMDERTLGDFLNNVSNIGIAVDQTELIVGQNRLTVEIIGRTFNIGENKYLLLSIKDLSERVQYEKKLEDYAENLKKFQLAVENASDQIVITDSDGVVIYANDSLQTIAGYAREEVIGKKAGIKDLWGGLMSQEFYQEMWRIIKNDKKTFEGELRNRRKDGTEYDAQVSITPILNDNGAVLFFVAIERDITKAKEIDRAKTEFVSLASHQLRTPLSAINWYTEMLLEEDSGKINDTQREYLKEIFKGNKRMVDLVNSLLNVSRIDMGTFDINTEPINIVDMAKDEIKELTPIVSAKSLSVNTHFEDLPMVMLDPKLTRIIFQNLLSNAVKYTPSKGVVDLTIGKEDEKYIIVTVKDSGFGIPKKQQDKVFSKLFRADNVQALDTEGTGLGLYIVKSIIDAAGGEVSFTSEENKGTTFVVKLPFAGMKEKTGTKSLDVS